MKVVVDTNILVSGIFWAGRPRQVLECWRDGQFHLLVTTDILDEYFRILHQIGSSEEGLVSDWLDYVSTNSLVVLKTVTVDLCRDKADNKL